MAVTLEGDNLNKVNLKTLSFEITRDCNLQCMHCGRGNSQKITISEEIIDKVLDNINSCPYIVLTGGEPLLNVPLIKKIFEKIKENKIFVYGISITTNGSIRSKDFVDIIKQYPDICKEFLFKYSSDVFHKSQLSNWKEEIEETVNFYKKYDIELEDLENPASYETLSFTGRAKNLKDKIKRLKWDKKLHMVKFIDNDKFYDIPESSLYYSANGNIYLASMHSFEDVDKENLGNVMDDKRNIIDMIFYWNRKYPITEREYGIYKFFKGNKELNGYKGGEKEKEITEGIINRFENLIELRRNLLNDHPQYTTEQIIEITPIDKYICPDISNIFDRTNK